MRKEITAILLFALGCAVAAQVAASVNVGSQNMIPPSSGMASYVDPVSVEVDSICYHELVCYWIGGDLVCVWKEVCGYEQEPFNGDPPFGP